MTDDRREYLVRWGRAVSLILAGSILAIGIGIVALGFLTQPPEVRAIDYQIYMARAHDFVEGRGLYLPRQLAGPYHIEVGDSLYPPPTVLLFVPFLWLPAVLWWAIPATIIAVTLVRLRPAWWSWPLIAFCLAGATTSMLSWSKGNPNIWVTAAVAVATVWPGAGAIALLKPSLAPFALVGVTDRRWWVVLAALGVVSLAFLPMWADYVRVTLDSDGGWTYSLFDAPLLAAPLVARLASTRRPVFGLAPLWRLRPEPA